MQQKNRSYSPLDWKRMPVVKAGRRSPITDHRPHHNSGWRIKDRYAALLFILAMAATAAFIYFKTPQAWRHPDAQRSTLNAQRTEGWHKLPQTDTDKNLAAILDRIERGR